MSVNLRGCGIEKEDQIVLREDSELDLRDNGLGKFSLEAENCQSLKVLLLARNILRTFANSLFYKNLIILDVSDNQIQKLELGQLTQLKILNASGNQIQDVSSLTGLQNCKCLKVLSVARNHISDCLPLLDAIRESCVIVLDVIGNPGKLYNRDIGVLTSICIFNARPVSTSKSIPTELRTQAQQASIYWSPDSMRGLSTEAQTSHAEAHPSVDNTAPDQQAERSIRDSADDLAGNVRPPPADSSVSEFESAYDPEAQQESPTQLNLGLVERQDSANYQPRPPALTERQDSAQNLQALAEEEAALAALVENPLPRQDSAHELDDLSPHARRAGSSGLPSRDTSNPPQVISELPSSSSPVSGWTDSHLGPDGKLRTDSPFQNSHIVPSSPQTVAEWGHERTNSGPMSPDAEPSASLEAARQLMRMPMASSSQSFSPLVSNSSNFLARQDSASDTFVGQEGAEAIIGSPQSFNQAPLSGTPSNLLLQARQMMQASSPESQENFQEANLPSDFPILSKVTRQSPRTPAGLASPYDQLLTPLSPGWTAACIEEQKSLDQMPSIVSGLPFFTSTPRSVPSPGEGLQVSRKSNTLLGTSPPAPSGPLQSNKSKVDGL